MDFHKIIETYLRANYVAWAEAAVLVYIGRKRLANVLYFLNKVIAEIQALLRK